MKGRLREDSEQIKIKGDETEVSIQKSAKRKFEKRMFLRGKENCYILTRCFELNQVET